MSYSVPLNYTEVAAFVDALCGVHGSDENGNVPNSMAAFHFLSAVLSHCGLTTSYQIHQTYKYPKSVKRNTLDCIIGLRDYLEETVHTLTKIIDGVSYESS